MSASSLLIPLAPLVALGLAIGFHDARFVIAVTGILGIFLAIPYVVGWAGVGFAGAGVIAGFAFLEQPWGWVVLLAVAPFVLMMLFKLQAMFIANEVAMRSKIALTTLIEDGHIALLDTKRGESYLPKRR